MPSEVARSVFTQLRQRLVPAHGPRILESSPVHADQEAVAYEAMIRRYAWLLNAPFVRLVSHLGPKRGRVLDIGTGPGWVPVALAQRRSAWDIWALDAAEDMLARGRHRAAEAGVADRVHFVRGSATGLPFEDGGFDLVISHFTLHHIDCPRQMLDETARVTRAGGRIVIKDLLRPPRWQAALLLAVARHVLRYSAEQLRMYRESLDAALTLAEVRDASSASRLHGAAVRRFRGLDYVIIG